MNSRGQILILVLILCAAISALAFSSTLLLRPARQQLALHQEFAQAQLEADSALQAALARLDSGQTAAFANPNGSVEAKAEGQEMLLAVQGKTLSRQVEARANSQTWAVVTVEARAAKSTGGKWIVLEYKIVRSERAGGP